MIATFIKNVGYTALDLITFKRGVARQINGMSIRFPAKWSRYYENDYEKENYRFLKQFIKPGMHIIDIGAHIGLFSAYSSQLTGSKGKVICFEPTPSTFSTLKDTLRLNKCDNVTAVQAAVSDKIGTATFYVNHTEGSNTNSLVRNKPGKELSGYDVKLVTVDSIVSEYSISPSLVKIDAEGAELDVLKGCVATMRKLRPHVILGLHPAFIKMKGDSLKEIWDFVAGADYKVIFNEKEIGESEFVCQNNLFDVVLLPVK